MAGYGWEEYDVRTGGKQVIHDQGNKIDITTEFVKVEGGTNGKRASKAVAIKLTFGLRWPLGRENQGNPAGRR